VRIALAAVLFLLPAFAPVSAAGMPPPCTFSGAAEPGIQSSPQQFTFLRNPDLSYTFRMVSGAHNPVSGMYEGTLVTLAHCLSVAQVPNGITQAQADEIPLDASPSYYEPMRLQTDPGTFLSLAAHVIRPGNPSDLLYYLNSPATSTLQNCFVYTPLWKDGLIPHDAQYTGTSVVTWDVVAGTPSTSPQGWNAVTVGGILNTICIL
jgi:hypothetical protein